MGKFDNHMLWKHENAKDVFFAVEKTVFDENGRNAILSGVWMIQGTAGWWPATYSVRLVVRSDQYIKWHQYDPIGELRV